MTTEQIKKIIGDLHREVAHEEMSSSQRAQMSILERLMDRISDRQKEDELYDGMMEDVNRRAKEEFFCNSDCCSEDE